MGGAGACRYELPPANTRGLMPSASEPFEEWRHNVSACAERGKGHTSVVNGMVQAYQVPHASELLNTPQAVQCVDCAVAHCLRAVR